jgi:hypothetical protein
LLGDLYEQNVNTTYATPAECRSATNAGNNKEFIRIVYIDELRGGSKKAEFALLPTGTSVKALTGRGLLSSGSDKLQCQAGSGAGKITSMDSIGKLVVTFTGCEAETPQSGKCTVKSSSGGTGEIVTRTLKGLLGTVKSTLAESEVGLLFEPESEKTVYVVQSAKCLPETTLAGSVASEALPISVEEGSADLAFHVTSGKQQIKEITVLSGVAKPKLEFGGVEASEEMPTELDFESDVELV